MGESQFPEDDLRSEFYNLGQSLKEAFYQAWESDERRKLQGDIEAGLSDLGVVLKEVLDDFNASEAGQQIKREVGDLSARVRSGEVESKVREDLLAALKRVNSELDKVINHQTAAGEAPEEETG